MRIDQKQNLVFPVDTDQGTIYIHSTPISREVFEKHYLVLGKTFSRIMTEGLTIIQGPNMAGLLLRDIAKETTIPGRGGNAWDGPDGVEMTLFPEMRRLTNVVFPTPEGYQTKPYEVARRDGTIDDDDAAAVENALAFFTLASWGTRGQPAAIRSIHLGMKLLWAAEITLLNCVEFAASLTTLNVPATTTTETSSEPSSRILPAPVLATSSANTIPI